MNTFLSSIISLFIFASLAQAKEASCSWYSATASRYPLPQVHTCADGQSYYFGKQVCGEFVKNNAFCKISESSTKASCIKNAETKATKDCFEKYFAPVLDPKYYQNKKEDGICNVSLKFWRSKGEAPLSQSYNCGKDIYFWGQLNCSSGIYKNVFCKYGFASSGKNCAEDKHPDTIACYKKYVKEKYPELAHLKKESSPAKGSK